MSVFKSLNIIDQSQHVCHLQIAEPQYNTSKDITFPIGVFCAGKLSALPENTRLSRKRKTTQLISYFFIKNSLETKWPILSLARKYQTWQKVLKRPSLMENKSWSICLRRKREKQIFSSLLNLLMAENEVGLIGRDVFFRK